MIRLAQLADAESILRVKQAVWPSQESFIKQIHAALLAKDHSTIVLEQDNDVVGFASGFLTQSVSGDLRWELDLVAVDPAYHGRGLGTQLVAACTSLGQDYGVTFTRGLIALTNDSSARAFEKNGFATDKRQHSLYVASAHIAKQTDASLEAFFIPVTTLTYSGLWIEGRLTPQAFSHGLLLAATQGLDVAGVLISKERPDLMQAAEKSGFDMVGDYRWWIKP